jgi:hypothetical protein
MTTSTPKNIILSAGNAAKDITTWKEGLERSLGIVKLPKNFTSIPYKKNTTDSSGNPAKVDAWFIITSLKVFIKEDVPKPEEHMYKTPDDYYSALQKFELCQDLVKEVMKGMVSDKLYKSFASASSVYNGYQTILREVKYFDTSALSIHKSDLERIAQGDREDRKSYADRVHDLLYKLKQLNYPPDTLQSDFDNDVVRRFLLGATAEDRQWMELRVTQSGAIFDDYREKINEDAAKTQESIAHRQSSGQTAATNGPGGHEIDQMVLLTTLVEKWQLLSWPNSRWVPLGATATERKRVVNQTQRESIWRALTLILPMRIFGRHARTLGMSWKGS